MATKKQFIPLSANELNAEITSIGKLGAKLNTRIQIAALNAIHYSVAHGDIGFGQRLILAMNNGLRKNSLVAFLEKHGKFMWNKEEKAIVYRKRDDVTVETVAEISDHWTDAIKAKEPVSMYDFEEEAQRFLKKLEKQLQSTAQIKGASLFDYVSQAIAQYHQDTLEVTEPVVDEEQEAIDIINETESIIESSRKPMALAA